MREAATICSRPLQVDLWPFDLESGIRVTCDVGYLCANFGLPGPLCSRLRPDVSDRQASDVRCASSLNAPYATGGGIISNVLYRARIFVKYISHAYFIRRTIAYGRTRLQYGHKVKYRHSSLLWWYLCLSVLYRATSGNLGLWYHTHDTSHSRRLSQIRLSGFVAYVGDSRCAQTAESANGMVDGLCFMTITSTDIYLFRWEQAWLKEGERARMYY